MSYAENRSACILVDGDDDVGFLHAGNVLYGTADAAGKIDVRSNGFAGLTNLLGMSHPTSVNNSTGACHSALFKEACQLSQLVEVLLGAARLRATDRAACSRAAAEIEKGIRQ